MRKEKQIGIRVGVPAFFALEIEDVYRHTEGAHRALAFPDFYGLLIGLGLEAYRRGKELPEKAPKDTGEENNLELVQRTPHDLFRVFDEDEPHLRSRL